MSLVLAFDCAVSGLGIAVVRDGIRLAGLAEGGRDQAATLLPAIESGPRPGRRRAARIVADCRHHRTGQLHRRARRPRRGTRPRRRAWRAAGGPGHDIGVAGASRAARAARSSPPSTAVSATGSAPSAGTEGESEPAPFVAAAPELAVASGRQAVPRHRLGCANARAAARRGRHRRGCRADFARSRHHRPPCRRCRAPKRGARAMRATACRARSICAASTSPCPMARGGRSIE